MNHKMSVTITKSLCIEPDEILDTEALDKIEREIQNDLHPHEE